MISSSYEVNNFGEVFKSIILTLKPIKAVELGVLNGYSTLHIAQGLKINKESFSVEGHLDSYDLWDDYAYKHGNMQDVQQLLDEKEVSDFVTLHKGNAFEVCNNYKEEIDFLHVDISNTGETIKKIIELWDSKIVSDGVIVFEGGSDERDNIEWMKKYNCTSIKKELETNKVIQSSYSCTILQKFPSLTILKKI